MTHSTTTMLIDEFFEPKILIVSGKGGVGKTTVSAALALAAARRGRKVCVAEVDRKGTLARLFGGGDPGYDPVELTSGVWGVGIRPEDALREYLDVQYHIKRISKVFTSTHFVDYVTTAAPGLKDILVLGKVWLLENDRSGPPHNFDTIIVDAPAAGHMLTFLSAPIGLSDAVRTGPIRRQSDWLIEMLQDPGRTRVHLVTLPEEIPVSETVETATALRERVGVTAGALFANGIYSELFTRAELKAVHDLIESNDVTALFDAAESVGLRLDEEDVDALLRYAQFLNSRRIIQGRHLRSLRKAIEEPVVELPFLFSAGLALPDVETLADTIEVAVEKL
jgi:anion-transporting  ArsA/GET3 family ATPase